MPRLRTEIRRQREDAAWLGLGLEPVFRGWAERERTVDLFEQEGYVVVVKGQPTAEHDVQDDAAGPDVDLGSCVQLSGDDFRRGVVWTATRRLEKVAVSHDV